MVLNGLNYPFRPLDTGEIDRRLAGIIAGNKPFILHVGSNQPRKNREGVLRIFAKAVDRMDLRLVFAGDALAPDLVQLSIGLGVQERIVQVVRPEVEILEALYNRAVALLFPSRYEGFGWPPIEAQACGCPVVGSDIPPLVEVLGNSAELRPIEDEAGMEEAIRSLAADREYRERLRRLGFENVRSRFETARMMQEYVSLFRELSCQS